MTPVDQDTVDLREVGAALRRRAWWIAAGAALGLALAGALAFLLPPRFEAKATVLLRSDADQMTSGGFPQMGGLSSVLGKSTGFETEMALLTSRSVVGEVVDSLGLQLTVTEPHTITTGEIFTSARFPEQVVEGSYGFERTEGGFAVRGPAFRGEARPGVPFRMGGGEVVLASSGVPEAFEVRLLDREDAVSGVVEQLSGEQAGGEVARLVYQSPNAQLAAAVPNAVIARYMARRTSVDRGTNRYRYAFLVEHADSVRTRLSEVEQELRQHQEVSEKFDPQIVGEKELERLVELRTQMEALEVESRTLAAILNSAGSLGPQELAGYPTFIENPAINDVLARLLEMETRRLALLQGLPEEDREVVLVSRQIDQMERQLRSLATAYRGGVNQRLVQVSAELAPYQASLARLPAEALTSARLKREVERLSEASLILQEQVLQTRLAAMGEGGDVRPVDPAVPPRRPVFPRPILFLAIGLVGGAFAGAVGALGKAYLGQQVREPYEAEMATSIPALRLPTHGPLFLGRIESWSSLLVIPVGEETDSVAVAHRIAASAALKEDRVAMVDLVSAGAPGSVLAPAAVGGSGEPPRGEGEGILETLPRTAEREYSLVRLRGAGAEPVATRAKTALAELEESYGFVVVAVGGLERFSTASLLEPGRPAVLVARTGKTTRAELRDAAEVLTRLGVTTSAVILKDGGRAPDRST